MSSLWYINQQRQLKKKLAGGCGVAFSPLDIFGLNLWLRADDVAGADGIHPNDAGHAAIANAFLSVM
jgi:lysophospholipase L1-like esterase